MNTTSLACKDNCEITLIVLAVLVGILLIIAGLAVIEELLGIR